MYHQPFRMAKQHFLPAAFLGQFSSETTSPARERRVWVVRENMPTAHRTRAKNVGSINDFYRLRAVGGAPTDIVDEIWSGYEHRLTSLLGQLVRRGASVDANLWLRVLVPFVAGLFVRGPDFNRRFLSRIAPFGDLTGEAMDTEEHVNQCRLMEFQRLLAPVLGARWVIMHTDGAPCVTTNEKGFAACMLPDSGGPAWSIPIGNNAILAIEPAPAGAAREVVRYVGGNWIAPMMHVDLDPGDQRNFNESVAETATQFVVGANRTDVQEVQASLGQHPTQFDFLHAAWGEHRLLVAHEMEWYRLVSAVSREPISRSVFAWPLNFEVLASGWVPYMWLPTNLPDFASGLRSDGQSILFGLTPIPGFTDRPGEPFPWEEARGGD